MNRRLVGTLIACTATGMLGAGVAAATASAAGSPSAGSTGASSAKAATGHTLRRPGALLRHITHAEATVRRHGHDLTLDLQRGTLTAVHGSALTVRSVDGYTGHYTLEPTTRVRVDRQRVAGGSLAAGDRVLVVARHANGEPALVVVARTPGWTRGSATGSTGSGGTGSAA